MRFSTAGAVRGRPSVVPFSLARASPALTADSACALIAATALGGRRRALPNERDLRSHLLPETDPESGCRCLAPGLRCGREFGAIHVIQSNTPQR
jgi:hypothetical protein